MRSGDMAASQVHGQGCDVSFLVWERVCTVSARRLKQVGGGGGPLGSLQFVHRARARPSPLSALGAEPPITRHAPRRIAPALPSRGRRGADSCAADRAAPTSSPASQVVDVSPRGRLNWPATCLAFVVWRLPGIRLAARNGKHDLEDTTTFQDEPQYNARWAASDLLTAHVVLQTSLLPGACSDTHSGAPSLNIHSNSRPSGCGRAGHRPLCPLGRHFGRWCVGRWCR